MLIWRWSVNLRPHLVDEVDPQAVHEVVDERDSRRRRADVANKSPAQGCRSGVLQPLVERGEDR
jgi:hypothetical protein